MPILSERTIADQIFEFLAPVQPEDCRQANLVLLAKALKVSGPVIHEGQVVTLTSEADNGIEFDLSRAAKEFATEDRGGKVFINTAKIPPDEELSEAWKMPTAKSLPLAGKAKSEALKPAVT